MFDRLVEAGDRDLGGRDLVAQEIGPLEFGRYLARAPTRALSSSSRILSSTSRKPTEACVGFMSSRIAQWILGAWSGVLGLSSCLLTGSPAGRKGRCQVLS